MKPYVTKTTTEKYEFILKDDPEDRYGVKYDVKITFENGEFKDCSYSFGNGRLSRSQWKILAQVNDLITAIEKEKQDAK